MIDRTCEICGKLLTMYQKNTCSHTCHYVRLSHNAKKLHAANKKNNKSFWNNANQCKFAKLGGLSNKVNKTGWFSDKSHNASIETHKRNKTGFFNCKTQSKFSKRRTTESYKETAKRMWSNENYREKTIKATIKGLLKRPTSFENKISSLCLKYRLPFIYTGDGRLLIGFKNPDFINENNKLIIEVFLNYFKLRDFGSIENYMKQRREHFAKFGYKTIFIRQEEICDKNWEHICLHKIQIATTQK